MTVANEKLKIGVVGLGMVGATLKRYFEEVGKYQRGQNLFLYDIDHTKGYGDDINRADVIFVCVPTPRSVGGGADLSAVHSVCAMLGDEKIVVIKSTVPPGTVEALQAHWPQHKFFFNPEFLTERRAWEDMANPDRQVVGHTASSKPYASVVLSLLPQAFFSSPGTLGTYTFVRVNATEAEMGKYAGNVFGALKVSFGNVLKDFCDTLGVALEKSGLGGSVEYGHVRSVVAHDRRIGDSWLDAEHGGYRGYGGFCFIKDTDALISAGESMLGKLTQDSIARIRLAAGLSFLRAMRDYNSVLLKTQGLTPEDVAVHDHEWIRKKMSENKKDEAPKQV